MNESEKKDKFLDLARERKKLWNMKMKVIPVVIGALGKSLKETGGLGYTRTSGDQPNYRIIKISQNTEKSPGDLRRLAVAQTPVDEHQLTLE